MSELKKKINNLKKNLYQNNSELDNIDKISLQKSLFELVRECIKEREYEIEVGSYTIDVTPADLSVRYETEESVVEISNADVYYETTREVESRFFVVTNEPYEEYPSNSKVISVTGIVTNIDGDIEEHYEFELLNNQNDDIRNYLTLSNFNVSGAVYSGEEVASPNSVIIKKAINKLDTRTDVIDFFIPNKVVPVTYTIENDKYIREANRRVFNPSDYSLLVPTLEEKKKLVNFIYSSIVEYYTEYINNNL